MSLAAGARRCYASAARDATAIEPTATDPPIGLAPGLQPDHLEGSSRPRAADKVTVPGASPHLACSSARRRRTGFDGRLGLSTLPDG